MKENVDVEEEVKDENVVKKDNEGDQNKVSV